MRALIGRETCCKHRCDVKIFCCACANIASTNLKNVLRWKLDKFDKFTLFTHFVSGLHNCIELSQPLSCLYQAMQTRKTCVFYCLTTTLLYWYTSYCYHLTSRVELLWSLWCLLAWEACHWYCIEEVRYRNSFSAVIKDSSLQETKLKHFKNVFIFGNAMLVFQQSPF